MVDTSSPFLPEWFFEPHIMPGRRMNEYRGWEIYEKGIYDLCMDIKNHYGNIEAFISRTEWALRMKNVSWMIQGK